MRHWRAWFALGVAAVCASLTHVTAVQAAASQQSSASTLAITPAIQDRVLGPKDTSVRFTVLVSNLANQPTTFSLSSNDFSALGQNGGLTFQGSDISRVTGGHGLSGSLQLDTRIVTIPANGSKQVTATIKDVSKLAPGGHYTAVLAQALPDGSTQRGNQVAINQVVSSLIFLETAGQGVKTLKLLPPPVNRFSFSLPSSVNLAFRSTGNTQTIPRGIVTIDRGGHEIGRGIINDNSSLLLPGSTRLLQTPLSGDIHPLWPGRYTLRVQYRYEGSLGVSSYEKSFVYVNVQAILIFVLLLVLFLYIGLTHRKQIIRLFQRLEKQVEPATVPTTRKIMVKSDKNHNGDKIVVSKKSKSSLNP